MRFLNNRTFYGGQRGIQRMEKAWKEKQLFEQYYTRVSTPQLPEDKYGLKENWLYYEADNPNKFVR